MGEPEPKREETPIGPVIITATADDFQEWQRYLSQQKPGSRKPGSSLKTEYEQWLLARPQNRPLLQQDNRCNDKG